MTSRIRLTFTRPSRISEKPGMIRTFTGTFWQSLDEPEDLGASDLRDRDDDLLDSEGPDDLSEVLRGPEHGQPVDDRALLGGVVVEEAAHVEIGVEPPFDLAGGDETRLAGARGRASGPAARRCRAAARPLPLGRLVQEAPEEPHPEDADEAEDRCPSGSRRGGRASRRASREE